MVVLNFWGSWCPPCRREAPALAALSEHFGSDRVRFVGVDIRDSVPNAEAFDRTFGVSYPSLNDPGGVIALAFHGTVPPKSFPTTLVVDSSGHIAASVFGAASYDGLRGLIAKYRRTLQPDRRAPARPFEILDMARQRVGGGSAATTSWTKLMVGAEQADPMFSPAQEGHPSGLTPPAAATLPASGRRARQAR